MSMEREGSFRLDELKSLAQELDNQDKQEKNGMSNRSNNHDMEYVAPATGLYSSKSKGLSRDNLPRRQQQRNSNKYGDPKSPPALTTTGISASGHSAHSALSSNGPSSLNNSSHSVGSGGDNASDHSMHINTGMGHNSFAGHDSFAGGNFNDSTTGFVDFNYSAPAMNYSASVNNRNSMIRGTDTTMPANLLGPPASMGNTSRQSSGPPSLRRAHTGNSVNNTGNRRQPRGLAGKRGYRGGPAFSRRGTDESIRSGFGGPGLARQVTDESIRKPAFQRMSTDESMNSIGSNQSGGSGRSDPTFVSEGDPAARRARQPGARGHSPVPDASVPHSQGARNSRVPRSQRMADNSAPSVTGAGNYKTEEDELGGSMISDPGPIRPRARDLNFSRRRNEQMALRRNNDESDVAGGSLLSIISSNDGSDINSSDHSCSSNVRMPRVSRASRNSKGPPATSLQPAASVTLNVRSKGLSANTTNPAAATRLEPAFKRAGTTTSSMVNSNNAAQAPPMKRHNTADAIPGRPKNFRASKGLSSAGPNQVTRLDSAVTLTSSTSRSNSPIPSTSRSNSPIPKGSTGRRQGLIDDDVSENEDTFVQSTMVQMNFVHDGPSRNSSRNDIRREKFGLTEPTGADFQQYDPNNPATEEGSQRGGFDRNEIRREKFGLSEPSDIEGIADAGKGSKRNLIEVDEGTAHSTVTPVPEPLHVGAYRVRQPRSVQQQRPGEQDQPEQRRPGSSAMTNVSVASLSVPDPLDMALPDPTGGLDNRKKSFDMNGKMKTMMLGGALAIVAVIVIVVVAVVVSSGKKDETAAEGSDELIDLVSTRAPDTDMEAYLLNLIPEATAEMIAFQEVVVSGNETLAPSPATPQEQAFEWVLEDPDVFMYSDDRLLQRFALAVLYYATGGQEWRGQRSWLSYEQHECNWSGREIECNENGSVLQNDDFTSGVITALKLPKRDLQGNLPLELSLLTTLDFLDFTGNTLSGSIPTEYGLMTSLTNIVMDENILSGPIPSEIGKLSNLRKLSLQENVLTGTLPDLSNLIALTELIVSVNQISGFCPPEFGLMMQLSRLYLDQNRISGTLPSEIGALTNLQDLYLNVNAIQGTLPVSLGNLKQMRRLLLSENNFSGGIPTEMMKLDKVIIFDLATNSLRGSLPTEIGIMGTSTLRTLGVNENSLTGSIPSLARLSSLSELRLNSNMLTSTMPDLPSTLSVIEIDINRITGTLPTEIGLLTDLTEFWAFANKLTGTIPSELGLCTKLVRVIVDLNPLTGTIPPELPGLKGLLEFNISNTQISGSVPDPLCDLQFVDFTCSATLCGCDKCACQI